MPVFGDVLKGMKTGVNKLDFNTDVGKDLEKTKVEPKKLTGFEAVIDKIGKIKPANALQTLGRALELGANSGGQMVGGIYIPGGSKLALTEAMQENEQKDLAEQERKKQDEDREFNKNQILRGNDIQDDSIVYSREQQERSNNIQNDSIAYSREQQERSNNIQNETIKKQDVDRDFQKRMMLMERSFREKQLEAQKQEKLEVQKQKQEKEQQKQDEELSYLRDGEIEPIAEQSKAIADNLLNFDENYLGGGGLKSIGRWFGDIFNSENSLKYSNLMSQVQPMVTKLAKTLGTNPTDFDAQRIENIFADRTASRTTLYNNLRNEIYKQISQPKLKFNKEEAQELLDQIVPPISFQEEEERLKKEAAEKAEEKRQKDITLIKK